MGREDKAGFPTGTLGSRAAGRGGGNQQNHTSEGLIEIL